MKLKEYLKNLKKGEYTIETFDKFGYTEWLIIQKHNNYNQYTLCIKMYNSYVYYPYTFHYEYVKYYDFGYLKRKLIKEYGERDIVK